MSRAGRPIDYVDAFFDFYVGRQPSTSRWFSLTVEDVARPRAEHLRAVGRGARRRLPVAARRAPRGTDHPKRVMPCRPGPLRRCRSGADRLRPRVGRMTGALTLAAEAPTVLSVDTGSFLAIVATAAIAGTLVGAWQRRAGVFIPVVVVELLPRGRDRPAGARPRPRQRASLTFFARPRARDAVLLRRLRDRLRSGSRGSRCGSALVGWALSLALAYAIGGAARRGRRSSLSLLYTGSALATTAIGTLIPVLSRHRRAAHAVRHLPAGGRRGRGVRADPAADAGPLDRRARCTRR